VADDLARHSARERKPLALATGRGRLFNIPPPTQGIASLLILGQFDRLGVRQADGFEHMHSLIEATKWAYRIRDRVVGDPDYMTEAAEGHLIGEALDRLAAGIDRRHAAPWRAPIEGGDTAWMGAIDGEGRAASHIQSLFHAFGSGVVLAETGIVWQNRGTSYSLDSGAVNPPMPGRLPFHTLNPAMARLGDGRLVTYGTMGAHGQPQFQAAVMSRYAWFDQPLQRAVTAPRWLVDADRVLVEARVDAATLDALRGAGHQVELLPPFASVCGHAHAVARHVDGTLEGAVDPRSDGVVAAF